MDQNGFLSNEDVEVFFIYDREAVQSEWDSPETAVLYLYPPTVSIEDQCSVCGQLAGMVAFTETLLRSVPTILKTKKGQFSIKIIGKYIFCLGGKLEDPETFLTRTLNKIISVFKFYHGSLGQLMKVCGYRQEEFGQRLAAICEHYLPFALHYGESLSTILDPLPYIDFGKTSSYICMKGLQILEMCQRREYVLAGCILCHGSIVCSQISPELVSHLLLIKPNQSHLPSETVDTGVTLPYGVRTVPVYVTDDQLDSILQTSEQSPYGMDQRRPTGNYLRRKSRKFTDAFLVPAIERTRSVSEPPSLEKVKGNYNREISFLAENDAELLENLACHKDQLIGATSSGSAVLEPVSTDGLVNMDATDSFHSTFSVSDVSKESDSFTQPPGIQSASGTDYVLSKVVQENSPVIETEELLGQEEILQEKKDTAGRQTIDCPVRGQVDEGESSALISVTTPLGITNMRTEESESDVPHEEALCPGGCTVPKRCQKCAAKLTGTGDGTPNTHEHREDNYNMSNDEGRTLPVCSSLENSSFLVIDFLHENEPRGERELPVIYDKEIKHENGITNILSNKADISLSNSLLDISLSDQTLQTDSQSEIDINRSNGYTKDQLKSHMTTSIDDTLENRTESSGSQEKKVDSDGAVWTSNKTIPGCEENVSTDTQVICNHEELSVDDSVTNNSRKETTLHFAETIPREESTLIGLQEPSLGESNSTQGRLALSHGEDVPAGSGSSILNEETDSRELLQRSLDNVSLNGRNSPVETANVDTGRLHDVNQEDVKSSVCSPLSSDKSSCYSSPELMTRKHIEVERVRKESSSSSFRSHSELSGSDEGWSEARDFVVKDKGQATDPGYMSCDKLNETKLFLTDLKRTGIPLVTSSLPHIPVEVEDEILHYDEEVENDGQNLLHLYIQAHSNTVLALFMTPREHYEKDKLKAIWEGALPHVGDLEVQVTSVLDSSQKEDKNTLDFAYVKYSQNSRRQKSNLTSVVSPKDSAFVNGIQQLHEQFSNAPSMADCSLRNYTSALYGRRCAGEETYYQQRGSYKPGQGPPTPYDLACVLDQRAQSKLRKEKLLGVLL